MFLFSVNLRILVYPANPYLCILFLLLFCMIPNFPYLIFSNLSLWSLELVSCKLSMSIYSLFLINSFLASNEQSSLFNSWQPSQWQDYFSLLSQVQKELCIFLFSTAYSTCFLHLSSRKWWFPWSSNCLAMSIATLAITRILSGKFLFIKDLVPGLQISIPSLFCHFSCIQHLKWIIQH